MEQLNGLFRLTNSGTLVSSIVLPSVPPPVSPPSQPPGGPTIVVGGGGSGSGGNHGGTAFTPSTAGRPSQWATSSSNQMVTNGSATNPVTIVQHFGDRDRANRYVRPSGATVSTPPTAFHRDVTGGGPWLFQQAPVETEGLALNLPATQAVVRIQPPLERAPASTSPPAPMVAAAKPELLVERISPKPRRFPWWLAVLALVLMALYELWRRWQNPKPNRHGRAASTQTDK